MSVDKLAINFSRSSSESKGFGFGGGTLFSVVTFASLWIFDALVVDPVVSFRDNEVLTKYLKHNIHTI